MPPATIPTIEPGEAMIGDTWRWDRVIPGYAPADGWTLGYALRSIEVAAALDITATTAIGGGGFSVTVTAAVTTALIAGVYAWSSFVSNASAERYTVGSGWMRLISNLSTAAPGDLVAHWAKMIPLLEAALEARVQVDMKQYALSSRQATREDLAEYMRMLGSYKTKRTLARHGGMLPAIGIVFGRPR